MKKLKCHCGEVEAEINVPDNLEKVLKCNCSICKRKGAIMSMVKNEEIKMTTPVTQMKKEGSMTMQFYLPSRFNKENTPIPSNSDIKILNIKEGYYAVIIYSGRTSDKNFIKHQNILEKELIKNDISILSPPIKATYDGPFTLPMRRRNEAMFEINIKNKGEI